MFRWRFSLGFSSFHHISISISMQCSLFFSRPLIMHKYCSLIGIQHTNDAHTMLILCLLETNWWHEKTHCECQQKKTHTQHFELNVKWWIPYLFKSSSGRLAPPSKIVAMIFKNTEKKLEFSCKRELFISFIVWWISYGTNIIKWYSYEGMSNSEIFLKQNECFCTFSIKICQMMNKKIHFLHSSSLYIRGKK